MHYIGLMSGTSLDGIDAVLVSLPDPGQGLTIRRTLHRPYSEEIRSQLQAFCQGKNNNLTEAAELDMVIGELFAEAALEVLRLDGTNPTQIQAIGSHGQTLHHAPHIAHPYSLQIGNPAIIAARTRIQTVADFRAGDIAAGGEGAPLVPAFHQWLFRSPDADRVVLNIGGIANITHLPANPSSAVTGFDTGPGNTLLDQWHALHRTAHFDRDGAWAASGEADEALQKLLLNDLYFHRQPPKSTGREYFNLDWLDDHLARLAHTPSPQNIQAALLAVTAVSIADAIRALPAVQEIYVCGGGCHNVALMAALGALLPHIPLASTEQLGLHPDWVEATAFAWLARERLAGRPANLPTVTGAKLPVLLGALYGY